MKPQCAYCIYLMENNKLFNCAHPSNIKCSEKPDWYKIEQEEPVYEKHPNELNAKNDCPNFKCKVLPRNHDLMVKKS